MIVTKRNNMKSCVTNPRMKDENDIKTYAIDKENRIIKLEILGGNLVAFETEYEHYNEDNMDNVEQHFIIDINLEDNSILKSSVITNDKDGKIIHIEELNVTYALYEKNCISRYLKNIS